MASKLDLTNEDVTVIEQRLAETRMAAWANPPLRPLTGPAKELADMFQARVARRRAAAQAEEERLRRERERAAERKAVEWEKNAPARQRAKVALAKIGREIQALEVEQERLYDQARELEQEAKR
jgi:DNA repair exonuclease SbcCD ATPase subunit